MYQKVDQSLSFYRSYSRMTVTVKMSSFLAFKPSEDFWRQYRLHPFPYILSQSKFTKETGPFSMDQSLFGLVHNYSLKKSLFTSDSLAQLSFKVACFVARGQKYSKFNFSRLSEKKSYFDPEWINLVMDWSSPWLIEIWLKYYQFSIRPC